MVPTVDEGKGFTAPGADVTFGPFGGLRDTFRERLIVSKDYLRPLLSIMAEVAEGSLGGKGKPLHQKSLLKLSYSLEDCIPSAFSRRYRSTSSEMANEGLDSKAVAQFWTRRSRVALTSGLLVCSRG